ncbi:hypothetical protein N7493_009499 [Penicillium malachiteum]|uniref:Mg2+ transporter protein, CorA-like/Zinc transport protein ZntB n=1 Tax=Penicillium malachiteum TaxID=1324776 RepID=A0AAD6HEB4_9EURO|nr:hypothetical protein N7493_009499 [Penicillium malachiteum]
MQFLSPENAKLNSAWNAHNYEEFEKRIEDAREKVSQSPVSLKPTGNKEKIKYQGFEWLEESPETAARIVFSAIDIPHEKGGPAILDLYRHYNLPGAFVAERRINVACSFGATPFVEGSSYTWFHFLCKDIPTKETNGDMKIKRKKKQVTIDPRQADTEWVHSSYCLKVTRSSELKKTTSVTLLTFGSSNNLFERFGIASQYMSHEEILKHPYSLLNVAFEVLHEQIDELAWKVADLYAPAEMQVIEMAETDSGLSTDDLDFPSMHRIQRYQIYLLEAVEALTETLSAASYHYRQVLPPSSVDSMSSTLAGLRYANILLRSTELRLRSLEKRTQSIINLAFNLVTQADSKVMKSDSTVMRGDSQAMKNIAILTMVFLPCTAATSFFSTPFFYLEDSSNFLEISPHFWILWAITIPLTAVTILAFVLWSERKLIEGFINRRIERWKERKKNRRLGSQDEKLPSMMDNPSKI